MIWAALTAAACSAQGPGLLGSFVTADRALSPVNQTLTGSWLSMGRRAAPPGMPIPPPAPVFMVFHSDGTVTGAGASTDTSLAGVWVRVAERKFLITYCTFNMNEARALVSIAKIRMTTQIDESGKALQGNQEVLVVDPDGRVLFTALGGSHIMTRIAAERPADYADFLAKE